MREGMGEELGAAIHCDARVATVGMEVERTAPTARGTVVAVVVSDSGPVTEASVVAVDDADVVGDQFDCYARAHGSATRRNTAQVRNDDARIRQNGRQRQRHAVRGRAIRPRREPDRPNGHRGRSGRWEAMTCHAGVEDPAKIATGLMIARVAGCVDASAGPLVLAGRRRDTDAIAHRLHEVRHRTQYWASVPSVDAFDALRPAFLERMRQV
jgi:hypothetical protein